MSALELKEAANALKAAEDIAIICHVSPDGDTLGSAFALRAALKALGKRCAVACAEPVGKKYRFLTGGAASLSLEFEPRFVVTADVPDPAQMGSFRELLGEKVDLVIDHHPTNPRFGKINVIAPEFAATGEIIYLLIKELGVELDVEIARAIFTAIICDTGCFRQANTTAHTHRVAAETAEILGAETFKIIKPIFDTTSLRRLALEQKAMKTLRFYEEGKIGLVVLTLDMLEKTGADPEETEGLIGIPRKAEGVLIALCLRESDQGVWRASLRGNNLCDLGKVAAVFGGGGHKNAAGCTLEGSLAQVRRRMIKELKRALEETGR